MWDSIKDHIARNKVSSLLEVGGGIGINSKYVNKYTCIELNVAAIADGRKRFSNARFELGNWLTMDIRPFRKKYDMFLAAAVVEHCPHYEEFIRRIAQTRPKCAFVTFFLELRSRDFIRTRERDGFRFNMNLYGKEKLLQFLEKEGLNFRMYRLRSYPTRKDTILYLSFDDSMEFQYPQEAEIIA